MSVLRITDIRELPAEELSKKLREIRQEVLTENAKVAAGGTPDNPGKLGELKKAVARIKTIARERNITINE